MSITFDDPVNEPGNEPDDEPGIVRGTEPTTTRWRPLAVVGALCAVAVALGVGFGIGRSIGDSDADNAAVESGAEPEPADEPAATVPEPAAGSETPPPEEAPSDAPASDVASSYLDSTVTDSDMGSSMSMSASGGVGYTLFGDQTMTPLAQRVTADGFTLAVHRTAPWESDVMWEMSPDPGGDGWQPAPWCYESGQMRVAVTGNGMIDVGAVPWFSEPYLGRAVAPIALGAADGQARWFVVVQVAADATNVMATFADGTVDSMAPQNGIAVLVGPPAPIPASLPPDVDVAIEGGVAAGVVASDGTGTWADDEFRESCQPPPPALPAPGEQPADPAAAEAVIVDAMTALYDRTAPGDRNDFVDDLTGVTEALDQVAAGTYADQAEGAIAVVEELVFTSPTESWFRYRIETPQSVFDNRFGIARQIDGNWKITRATICQDLAMAGGDCGGGWEMIQPPS